MPFTVTMPKLSPTMEEGTLAKWRKREGEFVKSGDVLFEVATDKATLEHSALDAGWLRKILIREGQTALVNQAVAIFTEGKEESIEGYQPEGVSAVAEKKEAIVAEASVREDVAVEPPAKGVGLRQPSFVPEAPLEGYCFPTPQGPVGGRRLASPLARRLARERGVDLSTVRGSGPQGRILSRDLALGQPAAAVGFGQRPAPTIPPGTYEEIPLSPMRKVIGQRLQDSKTFIPHFYVTQEVVADRLIQVREELKGLGIAVSFNDLVIRATALALRVHPVMNRGFNSVSGAIIAFKTIDLSIAVSLAEGLITPIIRHADYKNVSQISQEVKSLASRAKEGKLSREEYIGGSFTISNLGMFGISEFTAVINPPQAAILAVGGIEERPIVREGHVVPGKTLRLTVSADHRVIDGTDVAKFLKTLQKYLEAPSTLLMT